MTTPTSPPETTSVDPQSPWLGLASFTEETRQYFYGREEEVAELARRVQRKLLTVLFGQSGLGKTSILRAGIVPRLRPEGYCPVYVRIDYAADSPPPSEQIKQAIYRATEASGTWTQPGTAIEGESLWEFLHHRDDVLRDAAGKPVIPLLIFDQFEEIFTLAQADDAGRKRAAQFIEDLADLVENRPPKVLETKLETDDSIIDRFDFSRADYRILIALREDYLAHLEGVKSAMPSITQNRMRLARMNGSQALAAVMKPGGKLVSQEVAESIVRFVAGGSELPNAEVEPSLLSLICRELNNARVAQNRSEISADLIAGSNETILNEFYERALADQPPAVRKAIEDHLLTESGYRENLAEERVLKAFTAAEAKPDATTTLATLVNRRLLRIEDRLDIRRVELTHDVLCGVVKASREQRLEREAKEAAEKNLAAQKERARATKKALIRARQIAIGCAALSVVAIGSAIHGFFSAQRAQTAEAEAVKVRVVSETSRAEAEKLIVFLLDDLYEEMATIGRVELLGGLAERAVNYYRQLPPEARNAEAVRNGAKALTRYSYFLRAQRDNDGAEKLLADAVTSLDGLRDKGDQSEDTLVALAGARLAQRPTHVTANFDEGIKKGNELLALLEPFSSQASPSKAVRITESGVLGTRGFSFMRRGRLEEGVRDFSRSRDIAVGLGALEFKDLAMTQRAMISNVWLGEMLGNLGRHEEAIARLNEAIQLADKLTELRPGHRPAQFFKATAHSHLHQSAAYQLQRAEALRYTLRGVEIFEALRKLDPIRYGVNNLRIAQMSVSVELFALGRLDEASSHIDRLLALQMKDPKPDPFDAANYAFQASYAATLFTGMGNEEKSRSALAQAASFRTMRLANADARSSALSGARAAETGVRLSLMGGCADEACNETVTGLAAIQKIAGFEDDRGATLLRADLEGLLARCRLAQRDWAAAESAAREHLATRLKVGEKFPLAVLDTAMARTILAIALARQGKTTEANATLQPTLAFFASPIVKRSDDVTLKAHHANAMFAAALANASDRVRRLEEAARTYDAMPPAMRRFKEYALIRDEIAKEMTK